MICSKPPPERPVRLTPIAAGGAAADAFGRLRVSEPRIVFDAKQIHDALPLLWDDQEVSGASTTSTHSTATASSVMGVALNTAGKRVRQTFQRFNYQPGKSLLIMMTAVLDKSGGGSGIVSRLGYFDDDNGVYWAFDEGTLKVGVRSSTSGSPVDTEVSQASFNGDVLDGTGSSGITIDPAKAQIFWADLEWLGTGTVRFGVVIDGEFIIAHSVHHANNLAVVYMSTPNQPLRYEIENTGAGAASTLEAICSTVITEAGVDLLGTLRYESTGGTHIDADAENTIYACIGIRLKSTALDSTIDLLSISMISTANDDFEWLVIYEPTVAGTFTYSDVTNSTVQTAIGATANTVTGGTTISGGMQKAEGSIADTIDNAIRLGAAIDGTPTEIVLCVRPLTANANIEAALSWRELV